jgi:hypothetical protein
MGDIKGVSMPWQWGVIMMLSKPIGYLFVILALHLIATAGESCPAAAADQVLMELNTAANNSYFVKWSLSYHMEAQNSWQNGIYRAPLFSVLIINANIRYYDTTTKK